MGFVIFRSLGLAMKLANQPAKPRHATTLEEKQDGCLDTGSLDVRKASPVCQFLEAGAMT
jgi:hypothetical protein